VKRSESIASLASEVVDAAHNGGLHHVLPTEQNKKVTTIAHEAAAHARTHGEYHVYTPPHPLREQRDPWEAARKLMRHVENPPE
jgi:hypothetical protein